MEVYILIYFPKSVFFLMHFVREHQTGVVFFILRMVFIYFQILFKGLFVMTITPLMFYTLQRDLKQL